MPDAPESSNPSAAGSPGKPGSPGSAGPGGESETRTLSLVKGGHHFCFRYQTGEEARVLDALVEMVNRREMKFDWFDAAVLSHQLGQHLAKELKAYLPKKAA